LIGGGFDLALRIAALADSTMRARRGCGVRRLLIGAPAYFSRPGCPTHPNELARHARPGYAKLSTPHRWRFSHTAGEEFSVSPHGPLRANNGDVLRPMLLAGLGLAVQPEFLVWEDLAAGRLQAAMTEWSMPPVALNIVMPPSSHRPVRVDAVIE